MMIVRPSVRNCSISAMPILKLGRIEAGEPLVEQQDFRIGSERAGKLHALLVDVGQCRDRALPALGSPTRAQQAVGMIIKLSAPALGMAEHAAGRDVFEHRHRRQHAHELKGAGDTFLSRSGWRPIPAIASP